MEELELARRVDEQAAQIRILSERLALATERLSALEAIIQQMNSGSSHEGAQSDARYGFLIPPNYPGVCENFTASLFAHAPSRPGEQLSDFDSPLPVDLTDGDLILYEISAMLKCGKTLVLCSDSGVLGFSDQPAFEAFVEVSEHQPLTSEDSHSAVCNVGFRPGGIIGTTNWTSAAPQ